MRFASSTQMNESNRSTLAQAFTTLSIQTSREAEAHSVIAGTLLSDISIPMKNLAEAQTKERKPVNGSMDQT